MQCDFCQDEPALLVLSNMENGDTKTVGPFCLPYFVRSMAEELGMSVTLPDAEPAGQPGPEPGAEPAASGGEVDAPKPARKRASKAAGPRTPAGAGKGTPDPAAAVSGPAAAGSDEAHRTMQEVTGGTP